MHHVTVEALGRPGVPLVIGPGMSGPHAAPRANSGIWPIAVPSTSFFPRWPTDAFASPYRLPSTFPMKRKKEIEAKTRRVQRGGVAQNRF